MPDDGQFLLALRVGETQQVGPFIIGSNFADVVSFPSVSELRMLAHLGHDMTKRGVWIMADALRWLRTYYPDEVYNIDLGEYDAGYINNLIYVATWWKPEHRVADLGLSFHMILTARIRQAILDDNEQEIQICRRWLMDAHQRGMTKEELRLAVKENPVPFSLRLDNPFVVPDVQEMVIENKEQSFRDAIEWAHDLAAWLSNNGGQEYLPFIEQLTSLLDMAAHWARRKEML